MKVNSNKAKKLYKIFLRTFAISFILIFCCLSLFYVFLITGEKGMAMSLTYEYEKKEEPENKFELPYNDIVPFFEDRIIYTL